VGKRKFGATIIADNVESGFGQAKMKGYDHFDY
jgi:hypothetical protein